MAVILQLVFVYVCFVVRVVRSEEIDHRFFLSQLIREYGTNGTISYEGFERLYQNLGLGTPSLDSAKSNNTKKSTESLSRGSRHVENIIKSNDCKTGEELANLIELHDELITQPSPLPTSPQCLSASQLLAVYGVCGTNISLSPVTFIHMCPAIIYELDKRTCSQSNNHHHMGSTSVTNWLYAVGMVLFISLTGFVCVALVPLLQKSFISQLISFLVALAAGTLLGDAFLHLIPHVLMADGRSHQHDDSFLTTALIFLSTASFFTFEGVIKLVKLKKEQEKCKDHAHYLSVSCNNGEKEFMEMIKNPSQQHGHSHSSNNAVLMILVGDGLHNLIDGLAIGGSFAGSTAAGFATSVAVLTHELPHELGDFAVLLQSGMSVRSALLCNALLSLLSLFGTLLGLAIGNLGTSWIYAITAGAFIYIALANLVPEINRELHIWTDVVFRLFGFLLGGVIMGAIALFEHNIQDLFQQT